MKLKTLWQKEKLFILLVLQFFKNLSAANALKCVGFRKGLMPSDITILWEASRMPLGHDRKRQGRSGSDFKDGQCDLDFPWWQTSKRFVFMCRISYSWDMKMPKFSPSPQGFCKYFPINPRNLLLSFSIWETH